jgi:hypothetical protein
MSLATPVTLPASVVMVPPLMLCSLYWLNCLLQQHLDHSGHYPPEQIQLLYLSHNFAALATLLASAP